MRLLRTAAGGFINAATIVRLLRNDDSTGWRAILADGEEACWRRTTARPIGSSRICRISCRIRRRLLPR